jgi:hypothetical protein
MAEQFNDRKNLDKSQQPPGQSDPGGRPQRRSRNLNPRRCRSTDNVAEKVAQAWNVHPRTVYRAVEYHTAVTALAQMFGADILFRILNRQVRLNHRAVVNLSQAAQGRYGFVFTELGDAIRSDNTKMVNCYVKLARNLK